MNLAVDKGEVMFIIGTSGVGKSVTIKHLIGLLRIDAGEIWFDGQRVDELSERQLEPLRRRIGMVFQSSTLFDSMTLAENVALPLRKHGRHAPRAPRSTRRARASRRSTWHEYADRYPAELSDGMRKRAAIARTLALSTRGRAVRRADDRPRSGERAPHRSPDPRARRRSSASPRSSCRTIRRRSSASPTASRSSIRASSTSSRRPPSCAPRPIRSSSSSSPASRAARWRRPASDRTRPRRARSVVLRNVAFFMTRRAVLSRRTIEDAGCPLLRRTVSNAAAIHECRSRLERAAPRPSRLPAKVATDG